jgi:hypothetical protein
MTRGLKQPIPIKLESMIMPEEKIICSFKGDWIDYGFGGKTRKGIWVITDRFIHFMGKVGFWDWGTEMGDQVRHIPIDFLRDVEMSGKKINIHYIKDMSKRYKTSKRGMTIKKVKGESSLELGFRRKEVFEILLDFIK